MADGTKYLAENMAVRIMPSIPKVWNWHHMNPRKAVGQGLGYATANRGGCHLNAGYMVFLESVGPLPVDPLTTKGKAGLTVLFQNGLKPIISWMLPFHDVYADTKCNPEHEPSSKLLGLLGKAMLGSHIVLDRLGSMLPGAIPFNSLYLFPQAEAVGWRPG
jgi:aldehyde:ferredoxin oxidoreductase